MSTHPLQKHFELFSQSSSALSNHAKKYLPRFNYSACELWLCTELCHIINFDGLNLHRDSNGDTFIYNEDCKRDLTLYSEGHSDKPKKLLHIEAKVIYPSSNCKNSIKHLCDKLNRTRNIEYTQEGWVYLVWTQHYNILPENFFNDRIKRLKEAVELNISTDEYGNKLNVMYSDIHEICDGEILWRGNHKRIIVKAIAFSFTVDVMACANEVISKWESTLRNLAKM
ncbi:hypothetical protein [Enterobacter cancerogenus]|uniref:hypothetical protein n=1 Tax=Enterobacter cancerogenus TaxID=69218 RepID=UPI0010C1A54C|nr:hypothetical protein [Enterobacter cancerogenus]